MMALSRGNLLLSVLLVASCVACGLAKTLIKENTAEQIAVQPIAEQDTSEAIAAVAPSENGARTMRAANADPEPQQKPAAKAQPAQPAQRQFEQQILVVKGNPSQEELNDEIRKALRSLLGEEQGDQVQIRQLKDVDELRRVVPGAGPGPIGLKVVQ
uniref:Uncharacterized protein n=1 Tax=Anopheles atroparvus TaxID=41427 RepID=A0A182J7K4_ANOAO